jgi:photosystem II stability/assembly factor-like uncharacterized protein
VVRTDDFGLSWSDATAGLGGQAIIDVAFDARTRGRVVASPMAPSSQVFVSHDAGASWRPGPVAPWAFPWIWAVAGERWYGTAGEWPWRRVVRHDEATGEWTDVSAGLPPLSPPDTRHWVQLVMPDPADSDTVLVAMAGAGVWQTTDGGTSWCPLTDADVDLRAYSGGLHVVDAPHATLHLATCGGVWSIEIPGNAPRARRWRHLGECR